MPPKTAAKGSKKEPSKKPMKPKEGGGKAKKKKWSKGKVRDKLNNMVLFDKPTYEKLLKEVPQYKLITPSVVSERLKIRASLARHALTELHRRGMRINESLLISTTRLCLIPYQLVHVEKYHRWMQSPDLRKATSSELLSLAEEYDAQKNWLESQDRLTFILLDKLQFESVHSTSVVPNCNPIVSTDTTPSKFKLDAEIEAMIGDVNLFLMPVNDPEIQSSTNKVDTYEGEISVMLAEPKARGRGLAAEALAGLMEFVGRHLSIRLNTVVAKVSLENHHSLHFFQNRLGFIERTRNNVFNEVEFVPPQLDTTASRDHFSTKNIGLATSNYIVERLKQTSPEFASSGWHYQEWDLEYWRHKRLGSQ